MRQAPATERYEQPYTTQLAMIEPIYLILILSKNCKRQLEVWLISLPGAIVQTGQCSAPFGMGHFADITRSRNTAKADSKPKQKSTRYEHMHVHRRSLDASADDDNDSTGEHPCATAKIVIHRTGENNSWDRSNVVDCKNKAC